MDTPNCEEAIERKRGEWDRKRRWEKLEWGGGEGWMMSHSTVIYPILGTHFPRPIVVRFTSP